MPGYDGQHEASKPSGYLSNKVYDALKWVAQIFLPGFATFYFSLGEIWEFPNVSEVVRTIVAVDLFLGLLLGLSSAKYNRSMPAGPPIVGAITVEETDTKKKYNLDLDGEPEDLIDGQDEVVFKIRRPDSV